MGICNKAYSFPSTTWFVALIIITPSLSVELNDNLLLVLLGSSNGIGLQLYSQDLETRFAGTIGLGTDFSNVSCIGEPECVIDDITLRVEALPAGVSISWETKSESVIFKDCFDLGEVYWYGGPERLVQKWPIEKLNISGAEPYVIKRSDNFAVAERYWLNSEGAYIFVDDKTPLFVDQNNEDAGRVCFVAKIEDPYINRERIIFNYTIVVQDDPKLAHLHAVNNFLGKPQGHPDERMIKYPIWTTWAKYKRDISDDTVLRFAQDILDHGYENVQIEIDDFWETCYGTQTFNTETFANISQTVQVLKDMGFRVTLWVHPFVNNDCKDIAEEGKKQGYFVKDAEGNTKATWWNGNDANQIDFTNPDAAEWFSARLKKLQDDIGIDSFKFDAGEVNYGPQPSVYENVDSETIPNILTGSYLRTCAKFGNLIEVRSAWRTQDLPIFTRMIDKDSHWGENNGLYTLITTLLQMNINGYPMVLPDMIGGNGYDATPSLELIIRWTQANTFMPAMQFSYLPWDYPSEDYDGATIVKKFVDLHEEYSDQIVAAMEASIQNGTPVNAPIWWIDPTDATALATDDEYLLGEDILVAPIYVEGATSRDIYLPVGTWKDENKDIIYKGPLIISEYDAPIDVLPYFIRQASSY